MSVQVPLFDKAEAKGSKVAAAVEEIVGDGFDVKKFVENFDVLAEAAGGASKLKALVLELAVRGRLVPQDARGAEVAEGDVDSEALYALPQAWSWSRTSDLFEVVGGIQKTPRRAPRSNHFPYLRVENVQRGRLDLDRIERFELEDGELERWRLLSGDILVVEGNGSATEIGRCALWSGAIENCVHQNHIIRCRPVAGMSSPFALLFLNSPSGMAEMRQLAITTSGLYSLSVGKIRGILLPLPPLAEQKRIVAKVDQLMALCDELEARQTKKRETGARLTKSALEALTTAEGPEEFDAAWTRVVENFDVLIDRSEKVRDLRQSILSLAVRGRLTPPVAGATPVDRLLESIEAKRTALAKLRKASRPDALPPLGAEEQPFPVPPSWRWVRFGVASICRDGQRIPVSKEERANRKGPYDYYGASGVIDSIDDFIFDEPLLLVGEDGANLLSRSTPIAFLASGRYWVNNHAHVLDSADEHTLRYLALFVNAIDLAPYVTGTAQPKMNQAKMNMIPIAVPPVEDQHRIVARVEQLMKVCDQLEERLRRAEDRASKLVEAVVQELVA